MFVLKYSSLKCLIFDDAPGTYMERVDMLQRLHYNTV